MKPINRREFISVLGGATAITMAIPAFASTSGDNTASNVTDLYVKGLVMVDVSDPDVVRLGFPKAPGHKATLSVLSLNGTRQIHTIKGKGAVQAKPIAAADGKLVVPELIRMKEFYGEEVKSHIDKCPSVISIPRTAIRSIQATELTQARYTFVRADNGEEVVSFRPRQVADAIKVELSSAGKITLDDGNVTIPLDTTRELRVEYTAEKVASTDPFADHFHHYFPYIERPAALDFDVVPRKVGAASSPTPHAGHQFMMLDATVLCALVVAP